MGTINGSHASHAPTGLPAPDRHGDGRSGEVEALVTSDGTVWTWGRLIEEFGPAVHSYARSRGVTDADDVVQDVFAAVVQKVPTFSGSSAELRSFVFTVAFRRVADRHRRAYRRRRLWHEPMALVAQPEESVLDDDEAARAIAALDRLDERSRAVLRLRYLDGCDVAEIAAVMDLSTTNVRAIQSRALKRLRERVVGLGAGVRQWSLAVLAWSSPLSTSGRRRLVAGAWTRRGGGLGRVRGRMLGGAFGFGEAGVGAAGGASLVVAVSLTAASILGAAGSTTTDRVPGIDVVAPPRSAPAAGTTPPAPTTTAQLPVAPGPPEPPVGPAPTDPAGTGVPVPMAEGADESAGQPPAHDASGDDAPPDDPDVDQAPGRSARGVLTAGVPAPEVLAVPVAVADRLGDGVLAGSSDALTTSVTDLDPATAGAAIAIAIDAPGAEHTLADSAATTAPALMPATPEVGLPVIDELVAADQLSLPTTAAAG